MNSPPSPWDTLSVSAPAGRPRSEVQSVFSDPPAVCLVKPSQGQSNPSLSPGIPDPRPETQDPSRGQGRSSPVKVSQTHPSRPTSRTRDPKPKTRTGIKPSQGQSNPSLSPGIPDPRPETQDPNRGQGRSSPVKVSQTQPCRPTSRTRDPKPKTRTGVKAGQHALTL